MVRHSSSVAICEYKPGNQIEALFQSCNLINKGHLDSLLRSLAEFVLARQRFRKLDDKVREKVAPNRFRIFALQITKYLI